MQMSVSVRISTDDCRQVRMGPVVKWMWPMLSGAIGSGRKSYPGLSARAEGRYASFANWHEATREGAAGGGLLGVLDPWTREPHWFHWRFL